MEKLRIIYWGAAIGLILNIFFNSNAQTLSLQTPVSDYNLGIQDSSVGRQIRADVHKPSGKIVFVWCDADASLVTRDVYCAVYNNDMSIAVSSFRVNNNTTGEQTNPYVRVNQTDNSFIVVWASKQSGNYDIYAKKISLTTTGGTTVSSSQDINVNGVSVTSGDQVAPVPVFNYSTNELLIGFRDYGGNDGASGSIGSFFRRIDYSTSNLVPIGSDIQVNSYTPGNQYLYDMAVSPVTGELITVSQSQTSTSGTSYDIVKRAFINSSVANNYIGQSESVVNYNATNGVNGNQQRPVILINTINGNYIIAYDDDTNDGNGLGVYSCMYNSAHTKIVTDFLVNTGATTNNQLLPKVVWDEINNYFVYFYHYSVSGLSTIKYRIANYTPANGVSILGSEMAALYMGSNEVNTNNYYGGSFYPVYNPVNHKIYLPYDKFRASTLFNDTRSNGRARVFLYNNSFPTLVDAAYYGELKEELDAGWHSTYNKDTLYFKYYEKYNPGSSGAPLNYKIYDYKRNPITGPTLTKYYGMNFFGFCVRNLLPMNGSNENYFILEVTNEKGDIKMMRFRYVPEY